MSDTDKLPTDIDGLLDIDDVHESEKALSEIKKQQAVADLREVLATPAGRRFVWRLLTQGGVFRAVAPADAVVMAFREGGRNEALRLLNEVFSHAPEAFGLMMKEHEQ